MKVAVVAAKGLGDGCISLVLSHNLQINGHDVTTFSAPLLSLTSWFPGLQILPFPKEEIFSSYDLVLSADHSPLSGEQRKNLKVFKENALNKKQTLVENLLHFCKHDLSLPICEKTNGIVPPSGLTFRAHSLRVAIHPTSSNEKKNWDKEKYCRLAKRLRTKGFEPVFCMSPEERMKWDDEAPLFPTISDLASFLFESGYLIGNDSGLGHLASCLNIPTLTLFAKKSYSYLWRPGFGIGEVISPWPFMPTGKLRRKTWKALLTIGRVERAFKRLEEAVLAHAPSFSRSQAI